MSFITIPSGWLTVGQAVKQRLFTRIKDNLDDLDSRITVLSSSSRYIPIINEDIKIQSNASGLLTGIIFIEIIQSCSITEASIQLFAKGMATSGTLSIDIKKNTTTNPTGFTSIFTTAPSLNLATGYDYQRQLGVINTSVSTLSAGDILRVDITNLPAGLESFRITAFGVL